MIIETFRLSYFSLLITKLPMQFQESTITSGLEIFVDEDNS